MCQEVNTLGGFPPALWKKLLNAHRTERAPWLKLWQAWVKLCLEIDYKPKNGSKRTIWQPKPTRSLRPHENRAEQTKINCAPPLVLGRLRIFRWKKGNSGLPGGCRAEGWCFNPPPLVPLETTQSTLLAVDLGQTSQKGNDHGVEWSVIKHAISGNLRKILPGNDRHPRTFNSNLQFVLNSVPYWSIVETSSPGCWKGVQSVAVVYWKCH